MPGILIVFFLVNHQYVSCKFYFIETIIIMTEKVNKRVCGLYSFSLAAYIPNVTFSKIFVTTYSKS